MRWRPLPLTNLGPHRLPGAAAGALIEAKNLKAHYGPDIAASNITPQQDAAHHAYFGGRIELLKQGYVENVDLHCYDIASAYPAGMVDLPSLCFLLGRPSGLRPAIQVSSLFIWSMRSSRVITFRERTNRPFRRKLLSIATPLSCLC